MNLSQAVCVRHLSVLVLCATFSLAQQAPVSNGQIGGVKRPVTVADAIEMTRSGDNRSDRTGNVALFSPDGSKFAFVTQKSDLQRDVVTYEMWVFDTASALKSPKPQLVAKLSSSSNRPAIAQPQWLPDNDTLVFLGEQPGETPQVYKVRCSTKALEKLTKQSTPITQFSMTDRGDAFVYLAAAKEEPLFSDDQRRRGFFVPSGRQWYDLYLNRRDPYQLEIYFKTAKMNAAERIGAIQEADWFTDLRISPDGEHALVRAFNTAPPSAWNDYKLKLSDPGVVTQSACIAGEVGQCPHQFLLVDLTKKAIEPVLDAPNVIMGEQTLAAWTPDNTILLVNAPLPLDSTTTEERSRRERNVYVAEVTLPSRQVHVIDEREKLLPAFSVERDEEAGRLLTRPAGKIGKPFEFRKQAGKWKITELDTSAADPKAPLSVTLGEDINTPPKLIATDPKTKEQTVLLDLNPQFAKLTFGHVEIFRWRNRNGLPAAADLYYPTNYVSGNRYPLVIQTHADTRENFWIDGPYTTAYAAQALANKGLFVLQMNIGADPYDKTGLEEDLKTESTSQEAPFFVSFVESAIDELNHRGLISRDRVGITGFSRTVYHGEYLLTHSSYPFGAAVMADGADLAYGWCVIHPFFHSFCETMNGGPPWGDSLPNWEKESPSMRLDKINAPLLMQSITGPLGEWEIYTGLRWLKKPVELLNFYPEGVHELVKPQQKYLSEQSAVDWYCFWLKGEEDPDPAKAEQYKRWRELRKLQDANGAVQKAN